MQYYRLPYEKLKAFCEQVFTGYGFTETESRQITSVLLEADLSGIESHGIQRLIRYHKEITEGLVDVRAVPEIVKETPISATIEGNDAMGQILGIRAMDIAIEKAKACGIGMAAVRNSNHYGIAGYYTKCAAECGLIGICMTNTEAIMVPTFGRQPMLGTNPIAHFFMAVDYGMFGEKADLEAALSKYMQESRDSEKAEGQTRIYTHGEKEFEAKQKMLHEGIPVNEKTYAEMQMIAEYTNAAKLLPRLN